jgi:hypothetical protein
VDALVVELHDYRIAAATNRSRAAEQQPLFAAAEQVNVSESLVGQLQLLVLAGASPTEIVQRTGLELEVALRWMEMFCDVGDFRAASGWVCAFIVEPTRVARPRLAAQMRVALAGGLTVLDQVLAAETQLPVDPDARQQQHQTRLALRADQAVDEIPDTQAANLQLVKLLPKLLRAQRRHAMRSTAPPINLPPLPTAPLLALKWASSAPPASGVIGISPSVVPFAANELAAADAVDIEALLHSA